MLLAMIRMLVRSQRRPRGWPLDQFRAHLSVVMAPSSVGTRWYAVRLFAQSHPDPWAVTRHDVEAYLATKAAGSYRRSVLASLKAFYAWAGECGWIEADPTAHVRLGRSRSTVKAPTCDEVTLRRALRDAPDDDTRLMVLLGGRLGLRAMEIASVRADRISPDGCWLEVVGKGAKRRSVPLDDDELRAELLARGPGWAFPGGRGREDTHMTPGNVGVRLSRVLGPGLSGHSLRHRAATVVYRDGKDLLAIQQVLGHESIATTQDYLGLSDDEVREAWNSAMRRAGA
jgi:site-specific recombinase XerD